MFFFYKKLLYLQGRMNGGGDRGAEAPGPADLGMEIFYN